MRLVSTGVPQGSIVCPFPFNIFINDITHVKAGSKFVFILYADDTTLNSTLDSLVMMLKKFKTRSYLN